MALVFQKATKAHSRLRMALIGPAGAGKTWTSLAIAAGLGLKVAVIDTERGSAAKYADKFNFDTLPLETFAPQNYIDAIKAAEEQGYDVVVIDSLSHAWMGKGGALEQVDNAAKRSTSGNSFTAWRDVTPQHNALIDAMLMSKCHIIVTMRVKTEYVLEDDIRGKKVPKKVGLAPVQRDGLEYEFDVVGSLTDTNDLLITKTRCSALAGQSISKPGADLAATLKAWLSDGVALPPPVAKPLSASTGSTAASPLDDMMREVCGAKIEALRKLAGQASKKAGQPKVREAIKTITGSDLSAFKPEHAAALEKMLKELAA